jgi:hypothetical protein
VRQFLNVVHRFSMQKLTHLRNRISFRTEEVKGGVEVAVHMDPTDRANLPILLRQSGVHKPSEEEKKIQRSGVQKSSAVHYTIPVKWSTKV